MKLLDCTLRDGGYINDWAFGEKIIQDIISKLIKAQVDYIEVGFLRDCKYNKNKCLYNNIAEVKNILPMEKGSSRYSVMALHNKYDISKLEVNDGTIDIIRVTFHDYDIDEGLEFIKKAKNLGYDCFCNPINIMGYSDEQIINLIHKINEIRPYGFSIVDTFGSMMKKDLIRIYSLVEHNLDSSIVLGLHLHENLSLSFSLAQEFIDMHSYERECIIDGSLLGMGRAPGNLCIELIMDYLNKNEAGHYIVGYARDAIDDYIIKLKEHSPWGYTSEYAVSAKYNLHRNYAENLLRRGMLNTREIEEIIQKIDHGKKTVYDEKYINELFFEYQNHVIDDAADITKLKELMDDQCILLIAPGYSIISHEKEIRDFIEVNNPLVISSNFSANFPHEFEFYTNSKRYENIQTEAKIIITSNLLRASKPYDFVVNYGTIAVNKELGDNNMVMLLKLLIMLGVKQIAMAGFDGYTENGNNYYDNMFNNAHKEVVLKHTEIIAEYLKSIQKDCSLTFITPSNYEKKILEEGRWKAALFDLDGTLLDTTKGVVKSVKHTIRQMGLEMPEESIIQTFVGPPMTDSFKRVFHVSDERAQEASVIFRAHYKSNGLLEADVYPGIIEVMRKLKEIGIKVAVSTYKKDDAAKELLQHFGIAELCDSINGADAENKLTKKDIIQKCLRECDITEGSQAVLIGDSEYDAIGAEEAGINFIGVTYGFGFKQDRDVEVYKNIGIAKTASDILEVITGR